MTTNRSALRFIPTGATKITDKASDAVAYLYVSAGRPCARIFYGKQGKPALACYFRDEKSREATVRRYFEHRQTSFAAKAEARQERKNFQHDFQVGDVLNTCWGYEQTNREFFEVVEIRGKHVVLREIAQERTEDGWCRGKTVPLVGNYIGQPIKRLAGRYGVKIDDVRRASRSDTDTVGGVKVVRPIYWTAYA